MRRKPAIPLRWRHFAIDRAAGSYHDHQRKRLSAQHFVVMGRGAASLGATFASRGRNPLPGIRGRRPRDSASGYVANPARLRAVRDALSDVDSRDSERTLGVLGKIALV